MADVHRTLDTRDYKYTLRLCNIYSFFSSTMVYERASTLRYTYGVCLLSVRFFYASELVTTVQTDIYLTSCYSSCQTSGSDQIVYVYIAILFSRHHRHEVFVTNNKKKNI
jgi:hypothetical protein